MGRASPFYPLTNSPLSTNVSRENSAFEGDLQKHFKGKNKKSIEMKAIASGLLLLQFLKRKKKLILTKWI
jgi:hypothetical protein